MTSYRQIKDGQDSHLKQSINTMRNILDSSAQVPAIMLRNANMQSKWRNRGFQLAE
jgi:hypothetical protein